MIVMNSALYQNILKEKVLPSVCHLGYAAAQWSKKYQQVHHEKSSFGVGLVKVQSSESD